MVLYLYHKNPQLVQHAPVYLKNTACITQLPRFNRKEMFKIDILVKINIMNTIKQLPKHLLIYVL